MLAGGRIATLHRRGGVTRDHAGHDVAHAGLARAVLERAAHRAGLIGYARLIAAPTITAKGTRHDVYAARESGRAVAGR